MQQGLQKLFKSTTKTEIETRCKKQGKSWRDPIKQVTGTINYMYVRISKPLPGKLTNTERKTYSKNTQYKYNIGC